MTTKPLNIKKAILLTALLATPYSAQATITVNPNNNGSTDITNSLGNLVSPTKPGQLRIGNTATGHLLINGLSTLNNTANVYIGTVSSAIGTVDVNGQYANWNAAGNIHVGLSGTGTLNVTNGAAVTAIKAEIASYLGSTGSALISGQGSSLTASGNILVGYQGNATLRVENGGSVQSNFGYIDYQVNTNSTATITGQHLATGQKSNWTITNDLYVSNFGTGTLNIQNNATVSNDRSYIGYNTGSNGTVNVSNATWTNNGNVRVGNSGTGEININNNATVSNDSSDIGFNTGSNGTVNVSNATWTNNGIIRVGYLGTGTLNINNDASVTNANANIGHSAGSNGSANVSGTNATWATADTLNVGDSGQAQLNITDNATVTNYTGYIGRQATSTGTVNLTNATWTNTNELVVASHGNGTLNINENATVTNYIGFIGLNSASNGTVNVSGQNAIWTSTSSLHIGTSGTGTLNINADATVQVANTFQVGAQGTLNINGGTLDLNNASLLNINPAASTNFNYGTISSQNVINLTPEFSQSFLNNQSITNAQKIHSDQIITLQSPIALNGGTLSAANLINAPLLTFNTGTLNINNLNISNSGIFGNRLTINTNQNYQINNQVSLNQNSIITLQGGTLSAANINSNGTIQGFGEISGGNLQLNTLAITTTNTAQHLLFSTNNNSNDGAINNLGGTITFQQNLTNTAIGKIQGNGTFNFQSGLTHQGKLNIAAGPAHIFGDIILQSGSQIITSANANTVFYDNIEHNGSEIRTAQNATTTFFGNVTGAGNFTGQGQLNFEGTYSPGNSPAAIIIDPDVTITTEATLEIEFAGINPGTQHDQLNIQGDLTLLGSLDITLLDSFQLEFDQSFNIINVDGDLTGTFKNLEQHASAGTFNGYELFIDYTAGDGNDIDLFTLHQGDTNKDRLINQADLDNIQNNFGTNSTSGDSNHDNETNLADLFATRNNFGNTPATTIPEPSSFLLLTLPLIIKNRKRKTN